MTQHQVSTISNTLPEYKAVLWDMDGTLVSSEHLHDESVRAVGIKMGHPIAQNILEEALGVGHKHCFEILKKYMLMPISFEEWLERVTFAYMSLCKNIEPRENTVEIVKSLHKRGIKQAIFSNSPTNILTANTAGFLRFFDNPDDIFSVVLSTEDVKRVKPDPEGYILAAEKIGIAVEDCLVIEDSPTGTQAGKASGAFTILWPETPDVANRLVVQPDIITDDLGALFLK